MSTLTERRRSALPDLDPAPFTVRTLPRRPESQKTDPWARVAHHRQRLRPKIWDHLQDR